MFQEFPYTDMHQLNLDWIIKIAKDFLDQYTHIQELIDQGIENINETTADGISQLETKAEQLESLLNQWYETHSNDIALELASALAPINSSLASAIASFNSAAQQKASETIASIPADYTTLSDNVAVLYDLVNSLVQINLLEKVERFTGYLYPHYSTTKEANANADCFSIIPVEEGVTYYFRNAWGNFSCIKYEDDTYVSLKSGVTEPTDGYITAAQDGQLMFTVPTGQRALLTISRTLYESGNYETFNVTREVEDLNEIMDRMITYEINMLSDVTRYTGYLYPHYSTTKEANAAADCFSIIPVEAGVTYYFRNAWGNFSCIKYADDTYVSLKPNTTDPTDGYITAVQDGQLMFTVPTGQRALLTTSEALYNTGVYETTTYIKDTFRRVYTVKKDGTGDFTKLVNAIDFINNNDIMDATVYVGPGTWDIISEMGSRIDNISESNRGLYLKNRIHLIFSSNSVVTCNYTGDSATVMEWLSAFNSGAHGFTLENCRIRASKCRYVFHDERDQNTDQYKSVFKDCSMFMNNSENTAITSHQCIGGGLGLNGEIVIEDCYFQSINTRATPSVYNPVSYHNTAGNGKSRITIKGVYMESGTVRLDWYGQSESATPCYVHDCSFTHTIINEAETAGSTIENMEVIAWNNEIR